MTNQAADQQAPAQIIVHLGQLVGAKKTLDEIGTRPMDAKLAYRIQRIGKFVGEEWGFFMNLRNKLIEKFGEPVLDEKKKPTGDYEIKPHMKGYKDWLTSIQSIQDEDIVFPFRKINVEEFGTNPLTPQQIADLTFMLEGVEMAREQVENVHLNHRAERRKALEAAALGENQPTPAEEPQKATKASRKGKKS